MCSIFFRNLKNSWWQIVKLSFKLMVTRTFKRCHSCQNSFVTVLEFLLIGVRSTSQICKGESNVLPNICFIRFFVTHLNFSKNNWLYIISVFQFSCHVNSTMHDIFLWMYVVIYSYLKLDITNFKDFALCNTILQ